LGDFTSSSKGLQTVTKKLTQKLRISTHVCVGYVKAKQTNKKNLQPRPNLISAKNARTMPPYWRVYQEYYYIKMMRLILIASSLSTVARL